MLEYLYGQRFGLKIGSPSFVLAQAIFEPNLFLYKYSNILKPSHPSYLSAYEDGKRDSVPKRQHIKFRRWGITQKKACNIQNTAKVWNQDHILFLAGLTQDINTHRTRRVLIYCYFQMMNFFNTLFLLYFEAPVLNQMHTHRTVTHTVSLIMKRILKK
jgi:hypothetical protein